MWPENTRGWRQRWYGFRDPLGERVVVETISGIRSEGLIVAPELTPDDAAVVLLGRSVGEVIDVSHPALRPPRSIQRLEHVRHGVVVLADYTPGVRLGQWLDARDGAPPSTSTILYIARHVAGALRAIAEHAPGEFHGAVSLDRIVVGADARILLVEPGLGPALAAHGPREVDALWRRYGLAVPFAGSEPFGVSTDACQLGIVVLELLMGRRLSPDEFPGGLAALLGSAEETDLVGDRAPLGGGLFEWLSLALGLDFSRESPSIALVADALDALLGDEGTYVAAPVGLAIEPVPLEPWPFHGHDERTDRREREGSDGAGPASAYAPAASGGDASDAWMTNERITTSVPVEHAPQAPPEVEAAPRAAQGIRTPHVAWSETTYEIQAGDLSALSTMSLEEPAAAASEPADAAPRRAPGTRPSRPTRRLPEGRDWRTTAKYGAVAVILTLLAFGGFAGWRYWRDRNINQQTGTLVVDSFPAGAMILIDGIERGKAPVSLAVAPGSHQILAKSATGLGKATVQVALGQRHHASVPLEFGTDPGYVDINTDPAGAQVVLDGEARGRSPVSLDEVAPGEHVLIVEQGAARLERRFTLGPAERLSIYVPLAGWLSVRSRVPLDVVDRGRSVGSSAAGRLLVPAGRRRLQFVNPEFGINTMQDVVIMAGQSANLNFPLSDGVLSVTADVPAEVWVDGQSVGKTPTGNVSAPIGEHEVLVSNPTWGDQRLTVIVGLGSPTRLNVKLIGATGSRTPQRNSPKRSGSSAAR